MIELKDAYWEKWELLMGNEQERLKL